MGTMSALFTLESAPCWLCAVRSSGRGCMRDPDAGWRDRLTVIITTSPLPRHPCSSMLEAILLSLRGFGGLAGCRTLIVADGYEASAAEGQVSQ